MSEKVLKKEPSNNNCKKEKFIWGLREKKDNNIIITIINNNTWITHDLKSVTQRNYEQPNGTLFANPN